MSASLNLSVTPVPGSQDIAANTSQIDVVLSVTVSGSTYNQAMDDYGNITIDGTTINIGAVSVPKASTVTLYSARRTVGHSADGTKTVSVSAAYYLNTSSYGWLNAAASAVLPTIARATTPTIGAVTLGNAATIGLPRASAGFTHTLTYQFGGLSGTIATGAGSSATWTPPLTLANQIPNSQSGTGTINCSTYNGSTLIGTKAIPFTAYVPASVVPVISAFSVSPVSQVFAGKYVKGLSCVSYAVTASGAYGAAIASYAFSFGTLQGSAVSGTTGKIAAVGSVTPTVTVKDSRGRTATKQLAALTVYDYAVPSISSAVAYRSDAQGAADTDGAYIRAICSAACSSVGGANTLTRRVRYKPAEGSYSGYTTLTDGVAAVIGGTLSATESYVAEISAVDAAGNTRTIEFSIPTDAVTWNARDGGKGFALGKYSEKDAFECAMPAEFDGAYFVAPGINSGAEKTAYDNEDPAATRPENQKVRFSLPVEINGNPLADYIVEQGTSGIWAYRKWESGVAECWCTRTVPVNIVNSNYGFKTGNIAPFAYPEGLFIGTPCCIAAISNVTGGHYAWMVANPDLGNASRTCGFTIMSWVSGSNALTISYIAKGRWK